MHPLAVRCHSQQFCKVKIPAIPLQSGPTTTKVAAVEFARS